MRVFTAAFTSRSCVAPHAHTHDLTDRPAKPEGPDRLPHAEQVLVEYVDGTSRYCRPPARHLYDSMARSCACVDEATLFPKVFAMTR
jgi:hypothetical protein